MNNITTITTMGKEFRSLWQRIRSLKKNSLNVKDIDHILEGFSTEIINVDGRSVLQRLVEAELLEIDGDGYTITQIGECFPHTLDVNLCVKEFLDVYKNFCYDCFFQEVGEDLLQCFPYYRPENTLLMDNLVQWKTLKKQTISKVCYYIDYVEEKDFLSQALFCLNNKDALSRLMKQRSNNERFLNENKFFVVTLIACHECGILSLQEDVLAFLKLEKLKCIKAELLVTMTDSQLKKEFTADIATFLKATDDEMKRLLIERSKNILYFEKVRTEQAQFKYLYDILSGPFEAENKRKILEEYLVHLEILKRFLSL